MPESVGPAPTVIPVPPFEGARLKVKRAREHIRDFDNAFQAWIDERPYTLRSEGHHNYTTWLLTLDRPIPPELSLIVGDAIHNLRTALDHCVWELVIGIDQAVLEDQQTSTAIAFTPRRARKKYKAAVERIVTPGKGTIEFLLGLEAFKSGKGRALFHLHELDIRDKHHLIVPVFGEVTLRGLVERQRNLLDKTETVRPIELTRKLTSTNAIYHLGRNNQWECYDWAWVARYGDPRNPITPRLDFDDNYQAIFKIFFGEIQPIPGQPVLPALEQLAELVSGVINEFDDFARKRSQIG